MESDSTTVSSLSLLWNSSLALRPCPSFPGFLLDFLWFSLARVAFFLSVLLFRSRDFSWKSRFRCRYRPEGIFRFLFFGLILDPPPRYICFNNEKKANSLAPASFFPIAWPFLEKGGDWYRYTFFFSSDFRGSVGIKMAKASFSAYVLVKSLLKTGEKVHFSTKKSTTKFGLPFCFFPFPFFASKWLTYAVFALQKAKNVGRKRGLRHKNPCSFLVIFTYR